MFELTKEQQEIFKIADNHIIDTHLHYNDEEFNEDRDSLINALSNYGISKAVNIGTDVETSKASIALAKKYKNVYATVGIHPSEIPENLEESLVEIEKLCKEDKVVAVGEIGYDYYWDDTKKELQKLCFKKQIDIARRNNLPIVVHSREAAKDTFDTLRNERVNEIGGVVHCYSYGVEHALEYVKMGLFIGIGGVCTFKNSKKIKEVIAQIPIESIVLETDSPYLAPAPFRGKRNCSLYLPYVILSIAEIKNISALEVIEKTYANAYKLYHKLG